MLLLLLHLMHFHCRTRVGGQALNEMQQTFDEKFPTQSATKAFTTKIFPPLTFAVRFRSPAEKAGPPTTTTTLFCGNENAL